MSTKTNKGFLDYAQTLAKNLALAKTKEIAVGLPIQSSLSKRIYKKKGSKGKTVLQIGMYHEYGLGHNPVRSFLRVPFGKNKAAIESALRISFKKVADGEDVIKQLDRTGAYLKNISLAAFNNQGFGTWKAINQSTAQRKGMEDTTARLTDTGALKQSITYVVRNATA